MRIIGPSSMGVAASRPQIGLDASLLPRAADRGRRGDLDAVRLARRLVPRAGQAAGARSVVVRVVRRPRRRLGHRSAAVLRGRRLDAGDRHVHRGPRRPAALRPHRPTRVAAPPDRRRAHERRPRADEQRAVPPLRTDRGADGRRPARHRPGARHPAGAARRPHRRAVQLSEPAAPRRRRRSPPAGCAPSTLRSQLDFRATPADYAAAIDAALRAATTSTV